MGTRQKIIIILIACMGLSLAAGYFIHFQSHKQRDLINSYSITELEQTAKAAVSMQHSILYRIVFDYTYWDDFVHFVKNPDPEWAEENIATILSSFDFDGLWMYNRAGKLVYMAMLDSTSAIGEMEMGADLLQKLHDQRFLQYSQIVSDSLVLIQGATIHPTSDPERLTKPEGYFFLGKVWDTGLNKEVAALTGSDISILTRLIDTLPPTEKGRIWVSLPFFDAFDQLVAHAWFSKQPKFLQLFINSTVWMQGLLMGTLLLILLVVATALARWVSHPLKLTGDIISRNDTDKIVLLKNNSRDFERIGSLIEQFIQQKKELVHEKERAQESDRLKSAFLANMSHEIRTPLNGVLGFAELLMEEDIDHETRKEYLGVILSSGELLLTLINDIVDLSKIESGQLNLNDEVFNLRDTFNDLHLFFKGHTLIRERQIKLELNYSLDESHSHIQADQQRLKQILTNLLNNAAKFTLEGSIEMGCRLQDEDTLLFFVKDTGIGIPQECLSLVFNRFLQVENQSIKNIEGTGLGLAITKGLIELMGGMIWVESEVHAGSVFFFTLPLIKNGKAEPRETRAYDQITAHYEGKKFLVVDDIPHNYLLFKSILERTGASVLHAETAEIGIQILESRPDIDLVLMDLRLPGMNGYEATKLIRQRGISVPVVAQTAYSLEGDRNKAIESGCDDYIAKPVDRKELFMILNRLFDADSA